MTAMFGSFATVTNSTNCATTIYDEDGNVVSETVPTEWYRQTLRMAMNALGPVYSKWRMEHCPDREEELSVVLPMIYNVLAGLHPEHHLSPESWADAKIRHDQCVERWLERGFNVYGYNADGTKRTELDEGV